MICSLDGDAITLFKGVLERHGMMWFITKTSRIGGNKQLYNWIANLGLGHKETWVGWLTTSTLGIGKGWLKE
jgi:hypothetical protein